MKTGERRSASTPAVAVAPPARASTRALAASAANKASRSLAGLLPGRARRLPAAASAHGSRPSAAAGRQGGSGALHHAEQPGQVVRYLAAAAVAFVIDCRKGVLDVDSGAHRFRGQYLQLKATAGVRCPLDCEPGPEKHQCLHRVGGCQWFAKPERPLSIGSVRSRSAPGCSSGWRCQTISGH